ncbi:YbjP/YqhG family protein [Methylobacillus gramineus]|uniref:DUF3828 domain-containing protein n=1 Tax=Methylobacillus gramineus TaxID=755169 RepID=UPI001CFFB2FD|nr:DUF3828 domain-containing protein [Methylobacillus gramineus]MCB5184572.1 YbjP/YqhG family protein [Methylobacillus gramineus]
MAKLLAMLTLCTLFSMQSAVAAKEEKDEARNAATQFYQDYAALQNTNKVTGLPNMTQLDAIAQHFIPKLHRIFYIALREQHRCKTRDKHAPWTSGDIFSSSDEGFSTFSVDPSIANQFGRQATVHFKLDHNGISKTWTDEVVLRKENGQWMIYDIEYHAPFAARKTGKSLQSTIDKNPAC